MTEVFFFLGKREHELCVYGHAGYDGEGRDIVCSAVSAISYALIGFLENTAHDTSDWAYLADSGRLELSAVASPEVNVAFKMALIGLLQISNKYPDHVRVSIVPCEADDSREKTANN